MCMTGSSWSGLIMLRYQEVDMGVDCLGVRNGIDGICGGGILANTIGSFEKVLADCRVFLFHSWR